MKVPLVVNPVVIKGKEKFVIWCNGRKNIVNSPIKPYFYSYEKALDVNAINIERVHATALSNYQKKDFYKYSFNTRAELVVARNKVGLDKAFESNIPFVIRNRIDNPNLFNKWHHTNELKFLFLDIEQYSKPDAMFPTYDDRIISISWCGNDRHVKTVFLGKERDTDKKLLQAFVKEYKEIDPDVIVVYNKKYDIPTILRRCEKAGINTAHFAKDDTKPAKINIEGVVIYDVYDSARVDQSLNGEVANRGLKAVSDFFGFDGEREPLDMKQIHKYVGTKELVDYNKDDVRRLLHLFDVYWTNIEFNANDLKIPLSITTDLNITDLGLIVVGDEYRNRNIIADGSNTVRYKEIFQRKKKSGEKNYEGAIVDIYRKGYFEPVYKADFSSMYPVVMSSFNLSPDSTTLVEYISYGDGKFKIVESDQWYEYYIPDKVLNRRMVIQVLKTPGFSADLVRRFLEERAEYKAKWKLTKNKKYQALSDNRKVKANGGVYGIQGSATHAFGFAPIAIATTGIGRVAIKVLWDVIEELYPKSTIECDTDGIYYTTHLQNKEKLIELFNKRIIETFKRDDLILPIDVDPYEKGWFYLAKNYVLEPVGGGKLIYHGVAMKASSKSLLNSNLIKELAEAKLSKKPTDKIVKKYLELDFPLKWFAMSKRMGMHMRDYKKPDSTLVVQLARDAQKYFDIKPEMDKQYYYVKSKYGYRLLEMAKLEELDTDYYKEEIMKVSKMFDADVIAPTIDKWF